MSEDPNKQICKFEENPKTVDAVCYVGGAGNSNHIIDWVKEHGYGAEWKGGYDGTTGWSEHIELINPWYPNDPIMAIPGYFIVLKPSMEFAAMDPDTFAENYTQIYSSTTREV